MKIEVSVLTVSNALQRATKHLICTSYFQKCFSFGPLVKLLLVQWNDLPEK